MLFGIKGSTIPLKCVTLCGDFITRFSNDGSVLADAGLIAEAADVFAEHSKGILVPHDQVRHSAAGPVVVLIDREPLLMWESERHRRRESKGKGSHGFIARVGPRRVQYTVR